jgi:DMSO/TMAO reductase YedYZ heme-binding membrane subunit
MPLAVVGIGLMAVVVVSSFVAVRRRFSYETWHLIHLLSNAADAVRPVRRYGAVHVKIVVSGGKITDVVVLQLTDQGGRSVQLLSV